MDDLTPIQEIMEIVGADSPEAAVTAVKDLRATQLELQQMIYSLSVVSVVTAGGRPLFVQLPPSAPHQDNPPEVLEAVRDALVDASQSLRPAIAVSRHLSKEKQRHDEPRSSGDLG